MVPAERSRRMSAAKNDRGVRMKAEAHWVRRLVVLVVYHFPITLEHHPTAPQKFAADPCAQPNEPSHQRVLSPPLSSRCVILPPKPRVSPLSPSPPFPFFSM